MVFSPTINHILPERTEPTTAIHPSIHDTAPLHTYKPHLPTDQDSRDNLLTWLPYPGILKIVQLARSIERAFEDTPSQESTDQLRDLASTMIRNSRILAKSKAGPVVCSITISALFSGLTSHHRDVIFSLCQEFIEGKPGLHIEDIFKPICKRVESLVTSPNNWPQAPKYSIFGIFDADTLQFFTRVTDMYLNKKSSEEIDQFVDKSTLKKIATKHHGLWSAKNKALSHNSQLRRDLINPILRHSHSPLTIAVAKYSHTLYDKAFITRPSASVHVGWKEDQFRFQKFGIVLRGSQLFKQIQESCLQCQHRKMRPIPVHMGLANRCMFQDIRIFKFLSVDLKGPFIISTGKSLYALVMICLQTKITEIVLLDSRNSTAILEGFNVVFSFYSTPVRITTDKESGIIKISNSLPQINAALLNQHHVSIDFIPAKAHHLAGSVERRIKSISNILGTLDMTKT